MLDIIQLLERNYLFFFFSFPFINRDCPSKKDTDVLRAIGDVVLEDVKYPNIENWVRRITRVPLKDRER